MPSIYESPIFDIANSQYDRACEVNDHLYRILERAFQEVMHLKKRHAIGIRDAALAIGIRKVLDAKNARGLFP